MRSTAIDELLRQTRVTPLVRAARSQIEIEYLPPYGDPEVNIVGEVATYLLVSTFAVEFLDRFGRD